MIDEKSQTLHYAEGDCEVLHWRVHFYNVRCGMEMTED